MPITKSAKKSLKVSETKREQNKKTRIALSKALKSTKDVNKSISAIDKAAKSGVIHKNKAARLKSRMMKNSKVVKAEKKVVAKTKSNVKAATKKKTAKK
jgi:small subunit ribosomal protein S20